ncbi:MAG TPA: hypothetical protein VGA61_09110 [Anaerolineae bacterium]
MIRKVGSGFQLWHKDGSGPIGPVTTKAKAEAQERAIKANQARPRGYEADREARRKRLSK